MERDESTPSALYVKSSLRHLKIRIEKEGEERLYLADEVQKITGAKFIPWLQPENASISRILLKQGKKIKGPHFLDWLWNFWGIPPSRFPIQQLWRGSYYKNAIESLQMPPFLLRWIDADLGWGVFAQAPLKKGQYIAEYTGVLRKRKKSDRHNAYCFEYVFIPEKSTPYIIDAETQGGISRYINHSEQGNLEPTLATIGYFTHILLLAKRPIEKGEQLCYDYGPDYWKHRERSRVRALP